MRDCNRARIDKEQLRWISEDDLERNLWLEVQFRVTEFVNEQSVTLVV